eukprot:COSAG04_NODE_24624_length_319_cov_0.709091_1_plen_44_part_10
MAQLPKVVVDLQMRGNTSASDERDAGCLGRDPDVRTCDRAIVAA